MTAKQTELEAEGGPPTEQRVGVMPRWVVGVVLLVTMGPNWLLLWYATSTETFLIWTYLVAWFVGLLVTTLFLGWYLSAPKIVFDGDRVRFPRGVELRWEEVEECRIVRFAGLKFIRTRSESGKVASLLLTRRGGREFQEQLLALGGGTKRVPR